MSDGLMKSSAAPSAMHESTMSSFEQARLFSVRMVSSASLPVSTTES